jgi:hypothetical protein
MSPGDSFVFSRITMPLPPTKAIRGPTFNGDAVSKEGFSTLGLTIRGRNGMAGLHKRGFFMAIIHLQFFAIINDCANDGVDDAAIV